MFQTYVCSKGTVFKVIAAADVMLTHFYDCSQVKMFIQCVLNETPQARMRG